MSRSGRTHSSQATIRANAPGVLIASLIETCKLNDVDSYAYLKAALVVFVASHSAFRIKDAHTV